MKINLSYKIYKTPCYTPRVYNWEGCLIYIKIFLSFQTITPLPINFPLKKWSFHLNCKFIIIWNCITVLKKVECTYFSPIEFSCRNRFIIWKISTVLWTSEEIILCAFSSSFFLSISKKNKPYSNPSD